MSFSKNLFWDADAAKLDMHANRQYVIERVLNRGTFDDFKNAVAFYGREQLMETALQLRSLEPKSLAFISCVSGIPKEKFRCYIQKPSCSFRQLLINRGHRVEGSENGEIQTLSVDDVKVDLVNYPYDWISDSVCDSGTILAGLDDIVAMKLSAAANRGKKKDFIDIAILLDRYPLSAMFELYRHKFQIQDIAFALRGITYFDDAEADPMPVMHCTMTWEQTKKKISLAVRSFVKFE